MAHSDPMTWRPKDRRWTKLYNGKHYYVSVRQLKKAGLLEREAPDTKEASRSAMRAWWKSKEKELTPPQDPAPPAGIHIGELGLVCDDDGNPEAKRIRIQVEDDVVMADPRVIEHIVKLTRAADHKLDRMHAAIGGTPAEQSIGEHLDRFLAFKRRQGEAGERSIDRADCLRVHLREHFAKWIGPDTSVAAIGEQTVQQYYDFCLERATQGKISRHYARDLFVAFRQFAGWLAQQRLIPIPLNLMSREFGFKLRVTVKTYSTDDVKRLLKESTERTRLYLLLMLNTGGTQIDIAELPKTCLDLAKGRLTRKRYKTEDEEDVPTVVYPLWRETVALLQKHLNRDDAIVNRHGEPLALVTDDGKPLLTKKYNAKGQLKKTDAIRSAYNRVVIKLKNAGTPIAGSLKTFRKTAASKLEQHETYGRYVVHFLGQSPRTVAGRHYVTPSQQQFDAAIAWLETQFFGRDKSPGR